MIYLGLDLGTSSLKALLVGEAGQVVASASAPYAVRYPQPGWAESDPQDWWSAAAVACAGLPAELRRQVRAVGLSGQMHGLVLTEKGAEEAAKPLRPALLWLDTRTAPLLEQYAGATCLSSLTPPLVNPVSAGMFGPALLWVSRHEPEVYARAHHALLPKDWLRLKLTGEAATDPSDVSGTLLGTPDGYWHAPLVEALGLNPALLPPVQRSWAVAGHLTGEAGAVLGLPVGLPIVTGAGDTAAALFGSGLAVGEAQLTVGSGAQLVRRLVVAPQELVAQPALQLYRAATPDWYALAAMQNAGVALEWVRGLLGLSWEAAYAEAFAVQAAPDLAFLPYLTGERTPLMSHRACGSWSGLRLGHTRGHLMYAALEGVAFALRDGLDTLERAYGSLSVLRLAGGGTRDPRWQQLLADALNKPLLPGGVTDASGRGAALLAQWGHTGTEPKREMSVGTPVEPRSDTGTEMNERFARFARWKALQGQLRPWWEEEK